MTTPTHPALEALRELATAPGQNSNIWNDGRTAKRAIPALKDLLAERDELLAALKNAVEHIASDGDNDLCAGFSKAEVLAIFRAAIGKAEES